MVIDQKFTSKEFPTISYEVGKEKVKEFVKAIKGDEQLFEKLCPPTFPVVYSSDLLAHVLYDPEMNLNLDKLVHGEQEFVYHKPAQAGDTITSSGKITKIFNKGPHDFISYIIESTNQDGEKVCDSHWTLVVRGGNDKDFSFMEKMMMKINSLMPNFSSDNDAPAYRGNTNSGVKYDKISDTEIKSEVYIDKYRPQIYAGASGDFNAIHLDSSLGKKVGLGGYILHGMATMGFGANLALALINKPSDIKRYKVRFSAPVKPHDKLSFHGKLENKVFKFTAKNQDGADVLSSCLIEFA